MSEPRRILFVQKNHGVAGSELYLTKVLPALRARAVECEFLSIFRRDHREQAHSLHERLRAAGVPVHEHAYQSELAPQIPLRIARLAREGRFNILHSHLVHADFWCASAKALLGGRVCMVSTKHGYDEAYLTQHGFEPGHQRMGRYYVSQRFAAALTARTAVISQGLRDLFVGSKLSAADRLDVIPYGFDFSSVTYRDEVAPEYVEGSPRLVIVARLVPFKQHLKAFEVVERLKAEFPGIVLSVVGWGAEEERLREWVRDRKMTENIRFRGKRTDAHDFFRHADAALITSRSEGFGAVLLEAWHNKKPVVAFDVPAPSELIDDGVNGHLARPYDVGHMAELVGALLREPPRAAAMGQAGHAKLLREHSLPMMLDATCAFYDKALERSVSRA